MGKQVPARVASEAQFRENDDFHPLAIGNDDFLLQLRSIERAVGHLHAGHSRCDFHESIVHSSSFLDEKKRRTVPDFPLQYVTPLGLKPRTFRTGI